MHEKGLKRSILEDGSCHDSPITIWWAYTFKRNFYVLQWQNACLCTQTRFKWWSEASCTCTLALICLSCRTEFRCTIGSSHCRTEFRCIIGSSHCRTDLDASMGLVIAGLELDASLSTFNGPSDKDAWVLPISSWWLEGQVYQLLMIGGTGVSASDDWRDRCISFWWLEGQVYQLRRIGWTGVLRLTTGMHLALRWCTFCHQEFRLKFTRQKFCILYWTWILPQFSINCGSSPFPPL